MSSIDGNGKGNLLISYLFKSESVVKQVEEEAELKVLIGNLLSTKGYKFVIADDELIDAKLIDENAKEGGQTWIVQYAIKKWITKNLYIATTIQLEQ